MSTPRVNGNEPTSEGAENRNVQGTSKSHTVNRRTIVQGAAWSIPVVAVAVGAPLAAASTTVTLTFNQPSYSGAGCATLGGVVVTATANGAPAPGETVSVVLPSGYTFSDGSTTYSAVTGPTGTVTLPDIVLPASGGSASMTASTGAATASATLITTPNTTAGETAGSDPVTPVGNGQIPAGSTAVGFRYYLAPNGDLYYRDGSRVATGVTSAKSIYANGVEFVSFQTSAGSFETSGADQPVTPVGNGQIPAGSTVVGFRYYLAPNGDLYYRDGSLVAAGVTSAKSIYANGVEFVSFQTSAGSFETSGADQPVTPVGNGQIPAGSTVVGFRYYLAPNGDLYYRDGTRVTTGVTSAESIYANGVEFVSFSYVTNC
jgi:hypothetical protein